MRYRDPQAEDRIASARAADIYTEATRRGATLVRVGHEWIGPCPLCGGRDRFSINVRKQVFNCRVCQVGGDVIQLVQHLDACDFAKAVDLRGRIGDLMTGVAITINELQLHRRSGRVRIA